VHSRAAGNIFLSFHSLEQRGRQRPNQYRICFCTRGERARSAEWIVTFAASGESKYARGYLCTRRDKYLRRTPPSRCAIALDSTICRLALFLSLVVSRSLLRGGFDLAWHTSLSIAGEIIAEFLAVLIPLNSCPTF
jgi:hypothetical protein